MEQCFLGDRVLLEDDYLGPATLCVDGDGVITSVTRGRVTPPEGAKVTDFGPLLVMPGLVDSHVHVNEPGRTAWEGFDSATRAAAAGGITTIVDMPLNSIPPTTTPANLEAKLAAAAGQCHVDVAFWGGVVPDNSTCLRPLLAAGLPGFKCFLIHSGVDEFPHVTADQVETALQQLQGTGAVLLFHAEVDVGASPPGGDPRHYSTFLASRPRKMENEAIKIVIEKCQKYGVRCHIVHLSSSDALDMIRECKATGAPLTVETCNHYATTCGYLTFQSAEVPDCATQYKCCPPIRETENREALWAAVQSGLVDMVVSDHSPCTLDLKQPGVMDFMEAWGGIASVQFDLPVFWTEASRRGLSLHDVSRLMSASTARLAGLGRRKGALRVGLDADMVVWDPEEEWTIAEGDIIFKNKISPYLARQVRGRVHRTILRGSEIFGSGQLTSPPAGQKLLLGPKRDEVPAEAGEDNSTAIEPQTSQ
ncbi:allantoinase-like [Amphibalanus amphitrite]|uniref:allantoinase-like n=1 Tax=Amphibalanus amphitrite TaxID=1232801 RepID=UPI001C922DC5|nr:allantoinase-like [Amphibalanus amphitrite]